MSKVKIKTETPPNRCEICHQSDHFDLATLSCQRCSGIQILDIPQVNSYQAAQQEKEEYFKMIENTLNAQRLRPQDVTKKHTYAAALMVFNLITFFSALSFFHNNRTLLILNMITVASNMFLVEFVIAVILAKWNKPAGQWFRSGLIISAIVILIMCTILALFSVTLHHPISSYCFGCPANDY